MNPQHRIRLARRHAGLSQTRLASALGVQRSAVSHWEAPRGKNPSVKHLRELAILTRVNFEWLATGRGEMLQALAHGPETAHASAGGLADDQMEARLLQAFRDVPVRARVAVVEVVEQLALQRTGRPRAATGEAAAGMRATHGTAAARNGRLP